jgi:hypothetical protein
MVSRYAYSHPECKGVGEHHANESGRELPAEMRDLDLAHGTEIEHVATDEGTGALILAWTDRSGTNRNSAVSPEFFAGHFTALGEAR